MTMQCSVAALRKLAAGAAATLAIVVSSGPPLSAAAATAPPTGSGRFLDHHGPVLRAVQLQLIYWGSAWTATGVLNPSPEQITTAMRVVMAGPYLTGLAEYRGIGAGVVRGSIVITASDPPDGFIDEDVTSFLDARLDAGSVPGPDRDNQTLYVVVMPTGIHSNKVDLAGEHNYHTRHHQRIHFVWIADSGSLASATRIISHEVVESATDPEGSTILGVPGTCSPGGWCEIADICPATGVLDGITVESYWSNLAGGCVVPHVAEPAVKDDTVPRSSSYSAGRPGSTDTVLTRCSLRVTVVAPGGRGNAG
jgi:hypothetical protein